MNIARTRVAVEVSRVRISLQTLDKALRRLTPLLTADTKTSGNGGVRPAVRASAKIRVARVLQGRYMGYMRQLKPRQKALVRKTRVAKGVRRAIQRARELGGA
jgi:hypothetical protein